MHCIILNLFPLQLEEMGVLFSHRGQKNPKLQKVCSACFLVNLSVGPIFPDAENLTWGQMGKFILTVRMVSEVRERSKERINNVQDCFYRKLKIKHINMLLHFSNCTET